MLPRGNSVLCLSVCWRILKGLIRQLKSDGRIATGSIGVSGPEEEAHNRELNAIWPEGVAHDDVSGEPLDYDKVMEARAEEIREIHKHQVYVKVPIQEAWERIGKAPIKTRWIDINKGDKVHPEFRSRWVAKDFKNRDRPELFAATPPLEALKGLISIWMTDGMGINTTTRRDYKMDFIDVRRAFFHAEANRDVYVELPEEDSEPGMC